MALVCIREAKKDLLSPEYSGQGKHEDLQQPEYSGQGKHEDLLCRWCRCWCKDILSIYKNINPS
jgi:hypothetical protein